MSDDGTGAAYAAGVATATAEQAAEDAAEAEQAAEDATSTADVAVSMAADAQGTAWDAQAAVSDLRAEMMGAFETLRDELLTARDSKGGDTSASVPEPERKESAPESAPAGEDDTAGDKPKRHLWWGDQPRRKQ